MKCPFCGNQRDRVVDSREIRDGTEIRRRRECVQCRRRFTSHETVELKPLMVVKKHGAREPFDGAKVLRGLRAACGPRVAEDRMKQIVREVETEMAASPDRELSTRLIGEVVMEALRSEDHVAFVRFASVYRDFQDPNDFVREVATLLPDSRRET